jgi:hypothetical protein
MVRRSSRRQRDTCRGIVASRGDPLLLPHDDRHLSSGHRTEDHSSSNNSVASSSNGSLDLFSRTDQGFRLVGNHLLFQAPGLRGQRRGVGCVGSHTTSAIVLWRGPGHPDQLDLLQWEIWAMPIGFMQW